MKLPNCARFLFVLLVGSVLLAQAPDSWADTTHPGPSPEVSVRAPIPPLSGGNTISAGIYHSCAIRKGLLRCWGDNRDGQVGDGTSAERHIATNVIGLGGISTAVSSGAYHSCTLTSGRMRCWGHNTYGQLGDGSNIHRYAPVYVSGLNAGVTGIATGGFHTCAIVDAGAVKCWGVNFAGQLGNGTTADQNMPVDVIKLKNVVAISAGYAHTCALTQSGSVECWGDNSFGQLGDGTTGNYQTEPVVVNGLVDKAFAISAGGVFTCAVMRAGNVKCWGDNSWGELGDGTNTSHPLPADVTGLNDTADAVAAGLTFACAVVNAAVQCWGDNSSGQLGDGTTTNRNVPVNVIGLNGVTAIAAGEGHTCAHTAQDIECWGRDLFGELGDGAFLYRTIPVDVIGLTNGTAIGAGGHHTCALAGAKVECWGINWQGQVGDGTLYDRLVPVDVSGLSSGIDAITVGYAHNCARTNSGGVKCWGHNALGQIGDGTLTDRLAPVDVTEISGVTSVSAGYSHTCAVTNTGGVKCWGDNTYGEIGDGSFGSDKFRITPVDVIGLNDVAVVTTGNSFSCALLQNGGVKCWGWNLYGQLGDGTNADHILPADVSGLANNVSAISAGWYHACALMATGRLKCWGLNSAGQLGNGSTNNSTVPVDVNTLTSGVYQVTTGWLHSCALTTGGGAKCWGMNINGALGDGTTSNRLTPVDVSGLASGVSAISAGQNYTCALKSSGKAVCWGFNYYGQLGNNQAGHRTTPTMVIWLYTYFFPWVSQ